LPDRPGVAARLFGAIAQQNLDVDLIIQSIHEGNTNDIAFTVTRNSLQQAAAVADAIIPTLGKNSRPELGEPEVKTEERPIAKVSIAGAGMIGRPRVAAEMFKTLADAGINIQMISTSEVKVSCTIDATDCDRAVGELCKTFEVANSPSALNSSSPKPPAVRAVALDLNQARLAIRQLPDRPGVAAKLFGLLAEENISVDMIIQSQRCRNIDGILTRDIAFTVAQMDAEAAQTALEKAAHELGWGEVAVDTEIAKVSVVGSGMIAHPGVAAKMFEALSQHKINIQMIATSEIKISCVVDEEQGVIALRAIHTAFELAGTEKIQIPA